MPPMDLSSEQAVPMIDRYRLLQTLSEVVVVKRRDFPEHSRLMRSAVAPVEQPVAVPKDPGSWQLHPMMAFV